MNVTNRQLLEALQNLPAERLDDNVSIFEPVEEEFWHVRKITISDESNDVLDEGSLVLELDN